IFYPPEEAGSADFILLQMPNGHHDFAEKMIEAALNRQRKGIKKWALSLHPVSGFGLYATSDIAAGEMIVQYEEQAHFLVSKTHVHQHWNATQKGWFAQYAWPLTEEVWATWSPDPNDWKPINHGCDPNVWLEGLDMVARRPIACGEQLTIDYATFCSDLMQPFVCHCGAPDCRGEILATDHLEPFVERYGEHVSDYIRSKRQGMAGQRNGYRPTIGVHEHFLVMGD
ncbi:MAG: SET domain-containing protein-lysine N-methyltransferase, partial [Chloroflexota bacterium]|nr:SET domain-containing protein-lysine N-methyltransferase [Chloroflexota bacterium]